MQARKTIATVLGICAIVFGAVFRTFGTTSILIIGGALTFALAVFAGLLWGARAADAAGDRPRTSECLAATAGVILVATEVAYAATFHEASTGWRIALGSVLALFALVVARALWGPSRGAVGAALGVSICVYGALFDSLATAEAIVAGVLGLAIVLVARRFFRTGAAVGLLLAYAVVLYRLSFHSIGDVGGRTVVGAVLVVAFLLTALRWWLRWQPAQTRWVSAAITVLSLAIVVFTLLRGVELLGTRQAPREQAEAPAVGFVPPWPARVGRGFAVGMGVRVERCDRPVHVYLVAAGTWEYWKDHKTNARGQFKLGIPGTDLAKLRVSVGQHLSVQNSMDAEVKKDSGIEPTTRPHFTRETVHNMTVVSAEMGAWDEVVVNYYATAFDETHKWLEPRGQGTCFVRLPALAGNFTAFAAEEAAGAAHLHVQPDAVFPGPDGCGQQTSERKYGEFWITAFYCKDEEIVHGHVAIRATSSNDESVGQILTTESMPQPDTAVEGDPVWSCRSDPRRGQPPGYPFSIAGLDRAIARNCSGFVVVADPDAEKRRDVTLILVGIGVALGLGAFVELLMRWMDAEFPLTPRTRRGNADGRA